MSVRRWARGSAACAVAALLLTGCGGGSSAPAPGRSPTIDPHLSTLDRAVAGINVTRDPLVSAMNAVIVAANHVDAVDGASAGGDWKRAQRARHANPIDAAMTYQLVSRLPALLRAYSAALDTLAAAAKDRSIPVRVRAAVSTVVQAGRAEVDADGVFVRGISDAWPPYAVLAGTQMLWYDRATGDWYDGRKQAADEYSVLTTPLRTATNSASEMFGKADTARRAAADQWAATLEEVHPILYPSKS